MITVMETWFLKDEFAGQALELMQNMDDIVGPNAHDDAGWCGHARFFRHDADPQSVTMMYPWGSIDQHRTLRASEDEQPLLREFTARYCARPRTVEYLDEMPVEVEHDH